MEYKKQKEMSSLLTKFKFYVSILLPLHQPTNLQAKQVAARAIQTIVGLFSYRDSLRKALLSQRG